jgi:hypothetical protein
MHLLDYAFYMYWRQFEMLPLGLASKLGLHPVGVAYLSPGTSNLLVSSIPAGGSTNVGRECMNTIHFCPILYVCIVDKKTT